MLPAGLFLSKVDLQLHMFSTRRCQALMSPVKQALSCSKVSLKIKFIRADTIRKE